MQEPMPDILTNAGLGTLAAAVRRRMKQVVGARLTPYGLTSQQFWVILVLLEEGSISLHPLAQRVWMDDPTASRVVKAMTERGLLLSQPDPKHGRRILISLAPAAMPLAQELRDLAENLKSALVSGLNLDEQAALRHGLLVMLSNMDGMVSGIPSAPNEAASVAS
jgi:MarR family transcriptional regulator, transcriptional regulator for hemolysin